MTARLLPFGALLALVTAGPALAQTAPRPAVYGSVGYAYGVGSYAPPTPVGQPGPGLDDASMLTATLGGEAPLARAFGWTGTFGAALRLARYRVIDADGPSAGDVSLEGSGLQHLDLYGRFSDGATELTAGFLLDLGPNFYTFDEDGDLEYFTSDAQHAVHLGLAADQPVGRVTFSVALDGFLTLPAEFETLYTPDPDVEGTRVEGRVDVGNTINFRGGASLPVGGAVVGLDLLHTEMTRGSYRIDLPAPAEFPDQETPRRWLLSAAPYVRVAPAGTPVVVELAGRAPSIGWYGEHVPVGFTLDGGGDFPKVRVPLSLNVRLGL